MALTLSWVMCSALSCSRALAPPAQSASPFEWARLSRCASPVERAEPDVVEPSASLDGPQPQALLSKEAREAHLRRGPLLEAWRPLLSALQRPIQPDPTAWLPPLPHDLNLRGLWLNADLLISLGASLEATLRPLLRVDLDSLRALSWLRAAPELSPLASLTLDPEAEVQAWRSSKWSPLRKGSVGLILEEQRLLYLQETGEGVRLVQEVVRVNNKRGVEELGEVALPVNASLLSLYTLKPNGARRAPIVIPEKDSFSLQDVQPGDVIIARYLEPLAPLRRAGGVLTPRLPIQDTQRAVWRRVYHVWRLGARPLELYWHNAVGLEGERSPQVEVKERAVEGGQAVSVSISRALPIALEPAGLSVSEAPHLQVSEPMRAEREWGETLAQLRSVTYLGSEELEALRHWAGGVSRLGARVWEVIEEDRPLLEAPSLDMSLRAGQGSRALLLWASLTALGKRCSLWIARPPEVHAVSRARRSSTPKKSTAQERQAQEVVDPSLSLDHFDHVLISCEGEGGGPPVLYDPALYLSPRGVISTELLGGEARVLWPPPRGARCALLEGPEPEAWSLTSVPLSWPERPQERHALDVALWLDPEGGRGLLGARVLFGHAEHALSGEEGALLYERLSRASAQERAGWLERQWGGWLGATAISGLRFAWSEGEGLALAYDLKLTLRLPARVSISPQRWGERFASLERRRETLALPPISQQVTLSLLPHPPEAEGVAGEGEGAWALIFQGQERALHWSPEGATGIESGGAVTFQRQLKEAKATTLWRSRGGLISTGRYASWARFAREVSAQERALHLALIERR